MIDKFTNSTYTPQRQYRANVFTYNPQISTLYGYQIDFQEGGKHNSHAYIGKNFPYALRMMNQDNITYLENVNYGTSNPYTYYFEYNRTHKYIIPYIATRVMTKWIGQKETLERSGSVPQDCLSFMGMNTSREKREAFLSHAIYGDDYNGYSHNPDLPLDNRTRVLNGGFLSYCRRSWNPYYVFFRPENHSITTIKQLAVNITIIRQLDLGNIPYLNLTSWTRRIEDPFLILQNNIIICENITSTPSSFDKTMINSSAECKIKQENNRDESSIFRIRQSIIYLNKISNKLANDLLSQHSTSSLSITDKGIQQITLGNLTATYQC